MILGEAEAPDRQLSVKLYVLTASHPCIAAELTLRRKGLEYRRTESH